MVWIATEESEFCQYRSTTRIGCFKTKKAAMDKIKIEIKRKIEDASLSQQKAAKSWSGPKDYQTVEFHNDDVSYIFSLEKVTVK